MECKDRIWKHTKVVYRYFSFTFIVFFGRWRGEKKLFNYKKKKDNTYLVLNSKIWLLLFDQLKFWIWNFSSRYSCIIQIDQLFKKRQVRADICDGWWNYVIWRIKWHNWTYKKYSLRASTPKVRVGAKKRCIILCSYVCVYRIGLFKDMYKSVFHIRVISIRLISDFWYSEINFHPGVMRRLVKIIAGQERMEWGDCQIGRGGRRPDE